MDTIKEPKRIDSELLTEATKPTGEDMRKCPHCGTPYKWFESETAKRFIKNPIQVPNCDCMERIEKEEKARKEKEAKEAKLKKLFENSLMTPFFRKKVFSNLEASAEEYNNKKEFDICKKYANEFSKETTAGIYMVGKPGTGKTTLLAAVCNDLIKKGYSCLFITMSALFDKFSKYSYENAGDIAPLLSWLTQFDFIVIDDIGRGGESEKRQEIAYRIIDALMNYEIPTCFTANPETIGEIRKLPAWGAIIDRLKDMCAIQIEFRGESQRGRKWQ